MAYGYFGGVLLTTAVTIPLALKYLGREQYGLWAVSSQLLSYILLFDGGLSRSMQRLVGESVADPENVAATRRFSLLVGLSFLTACLLLLAALLLSTWGLRFLSVPPRLLGIGRELFLSVMAIQCVGYVFGPFNAILFAQNRNYITVGISLVSVLLTAAVFIFLLTRGFGLLSYVYSTLLLLPLTSAGTLFFVLRSSRRPKLRWLMPYREDLRQVFAFTSWMFVNTLVVETLMALPTLIITKFVGLGAMAIFYVSFRPAFFLLRVSVMPFGSLGPRWQELFLQGNLGKLREEYTTVIFLTIQSGLVLCICFIVFLKPLITVWVGARMYGGTVITASLGVYLTVYLLGNILCPPFYLAKKLGTLTMVEILELFFSLVICIFLAKKLGAGGVMAGSVMMTALFSVRYCWQKGPAVFGFTSNATDMLRAHWGPLLVQFALACLAVVWVWWADRNNLPFLDLLVGGGVIASAAVLDFLRTTGKSALRLLRRPRTVDSPS